ncbi:MAG: DUF4115 domain-containing protein [Elusimicrobia bacterium]|nr:DUF4115 domain-containing protein [Elusimicrobiota bacterium]
MNTDPFSLAGERLRAKRLELQLSLNTAKRRTKIPLHYLQALEEGDAAPFPAELYRRAFLAEYADFLGVENPCPLPAPAPLPAPQPAEPAKEEKPKEQHRKPLFLTDAVPFQQETLPLETRQSAARIALALGALSLFLSVWTWRNCSASRQNWTGTFQTMLRTDRIYENFFISHLSAETTSGTWARIDADGETLYEGYLPPGARKRWSAAKNFMVKLSEPASARFLLDNRPIPDSVFKASAPVNIPVTFSGFTQNQ